MAKKDSKLGFQSTWSMAVGGMVGGGIFSTLGVVISIAGSWAWLSFLLAGIVAFLAGYSYVQLAEYYGEGGGAFTFLREINANWFAGSLSWILIVGYILTNSVYAFTFGQYLGHLFAWGAWFPRFASLSILMFFVVLNLRGVGEAGGVEVFLVWFKLVVLIGLACYGLFRWNPSMLSQGIEKSSLNAAIFGAASVFMAYEGFQLLTYDYEDIRNPDKILSRAVPVAIIVVIIVYILVTLGIPMIIGAGQVVQHEEVALSIAGREIGGTVGVIIVTIAAAFSTGSAINSTLFATARLSHIVAKDGELPTLLNHKNQAGVPDYAVILLGGISAVLAIIGSLSLLVEAASLAFLFTFAVVSGLAFQQNAGNRILTGMGAFGGGLAMIALIIRLLQYAPLALLLLGILVAIAAFIRPWLLSLSNNHG